MATLMSEEGGAVLEIEYASLRKCRERLDHARVKMAAFLIGCAQVVVNNEKCVIFSLAVGSGNLRFCQIHLKNFSGELKVSEIFE
jgi:hypothetical protein